MAVAIQFYRSRYQNLKDSEETEQFTLVLNNLFDTLNRKFPAEGIRKNSYDFEVFFYIEKSLFVCMRYLFYLEL